MTFVPSDETSTANFRLFKTYYFVKNSRIIVDLFVQEETQKATGVFETQQ